jgi:hypothetical protein
MYNGAEKSFKISIDEVEIGMLLEDVFSAGGKLLLSSITVIDNEQIAALKRQGVLYAYIKQPGHSMMFVLENR